MGGLLSPLSSKLFKKAAIKAKTLIVLGSLFLSFFPSSLPPLFQCLRLHK